MSETKLLWVVGAAIALSGCAVFKKTPSTTIVSPPTTASNVELASAAVSVSRSLTELAAMEKAAMPPGKALCCQSLETLPGVVSVDWAGPIEPLLNQIAAISDHRFYVLGVRPAIPVMVSLHAKNMPLAMVVRDIDFQAANKASVMVYSKRRTIELRYRRS